MPTRRSTAKQSKIGWNTNSEAISSRAEINSEDSDPESISVTYDSDVTTRSSTDEQTIPDEYIGYFAKDYKSLKRIAHISDEPEFSAVKRSNNERCLLYLAPYTKDEYEKLKKLKTDAAQCPHLLNFSRIEKKDGWILLEVPYAKNMLDIFDEMNPDYGLDRDVPRDNFDEATIRRILLDLLPAIQFIHKLGYVHTVVRAASLYVNSDGFVLLGNLHMIRRQNELSITTPHAHMAPEMITRLPNLKFHTSLIAGLSSGFAYKSDTWSIGMLILELVNVMDIDEFFDRSTTDGLTDKELAVKILKRRLPWLNPMALYRGTGPHSMQQAYNRTLSPLLIDLYKRCIESDQVMRWSVDRLLQVHSFLSMREPDTSIVAKPKRGHQSSRKTESPKKRGHQSSRKTESPKKRGHQSSRKTESSKKRGHQSSRKTGSSKKRSSKH